MIGPWLKRELNKFSERYDYDTGYMAELVDLDPSGGAKLAMATAFLGHRFGLPAAPYFAAKIVAVKTADCGSCLRLAIAMAEEAGVELADCAALVTGEGRPPDDMALAARYARAVLDNDPALADILVECEARWGRRAIGGLAAAVVSGLFYPVLKRGLGYGNSCEPVVAWLKARAGAAAAREPAIA
ncbi:MAG: hypothetical protein BroJett030_31370 [Alphaproteobacteria bacterium]|nr:MAG: hypothetical protein BroJett030_31370 [Alphaproteobacteria bacterium]